MEREELIRPEFRAILDEFARVRNAHIALKAYCETQEEILSVEKERSARMKENLEKVLKACSMFEKRHQQLAEEMLKERNANKELKEQCDHLRLVCNERNADGEEIYRLQQEIEVLKAQLLMQEEKQNEDVALLKQQHLDEVQKYKMLLQNAKQENISNGKLIRGRTKNTEKNKKDPSSFRWPKLVIEKISSTPANNEEQATNENENETTVENKGNKKRKLFYQEKETAIDII